MFMVLCSLHCNYYTTAAVLLLAMGKEVMKHKGRGERGDLFELRNKINNIMLSFWEAIKPGVILFNRQAAFGDIVISVPFVFYYFSYYSFSLLFLLQGMHPWKPLKGVSNLELIPSSLYLSYFCLLYITLF